MSNDFLQPQLLRLLTVNVSVTVEHKSATTDHADRNNCIIGWEGAKVIDRERNRNARWIEEAIWVRQAMEDTG